MIGWTLHHHFSCIYQFSVYQKGGTNAMIETFQRYIPQINAFLLYANITILCLNPLPWWRTLDKFIEAGHRLPSTLYLQLDNTGKYVHYGFFS